MTMSAQMHTYHTLVAVEEENMNAQEFYNCIPQTLNIVSVINVFDLVSKHVKNDRRQTNATNVLQVRRRFLHVCECVKAKVYT